MKMTRRKRREPGACQDCGRGPVRTIHFWLNGMPYRVCAEHEREYTHGGRAWVVEESVSERTARRRAQARADERGGPVYLQSVDGSWLVGDDGRGPVLTFVRFWTFYPNYEETA